MAVPAKALYHSRGHTVRVRPLRQWLGLSLDAFARAVGVARATVARWEAANTGPRPESAEGRMVASMAEVRRLAIQLFGKDAQAWLDTPIPMLRDTPRSALVKRGPLPVQQLLWEDRHGAY